MYDWLLNAELALKGSHSKTDRAPAGAGNTYVSNGQRVEPKKVVLNQKEILMLEDEAETDSSISSHRPDLFSTEIDNTQHRSRIYRDGTKPIA